MSGQHEGAGAIVLRGAASLDASELLAYLDPPGGALVPSALARDARAERTRDAYR